MRNLLSLKTIVSSPGGMINWPVEMESGTASNKPLDMV